MSAGPPNVIPAAATANAPRLRKRGGCGCFGSVALLIILAFAVYVGLNPWGLHIGHRWTPAMTWHGVGKLQSTSGASYGLFLEVSPYMHSGRRSSVGPHNNLSGRAKLCTPQGEVFPLTVSGHIKLVWLDADRKPAVFYFRSLKQAQPKLSFELYGSWQGPELVLEDKGGMAMSFAPDGSAKGYLKGKNSPDQNTAGTLHYAQESQFSSVCSGKSGNTF